MPISTLQAASDLECNSSLCDSKGCTTPSTIPEVPNPTAYQNQGRTMYRFLGLMPDLLNQNLPWGWGVVVGCVVVASTYVWEKFRPI